MSQLRSQPTTHWTWTVPSQLDRADTAILHAIEEGLGDWQGDKVSCSRSQLKRLMDEGQATFNGLPLKPNAKLRGGSEVRITFPPPQPLDVLPEDRPIDILFEDEHLLVLNKPAGLTVHPSSTQADGTLVNALLHHIKDLSGIGGKLRPGIVHRIDKDTSGALVITKTDPAHRALAETFARHDIERAYWALCYGAPPGVAGKELTKIESQLGRNPKDRKKMATVESGGRNSVTYFRKIEEYGLPSKRPFASWLHLTLETGRTHQIRVHLTSQGYSLLGDPVYGTPTEKQAKWQGLPLLVRERVTALCGQALHARILGFNHPITGERLRFEAEPPTAFRELLEALQGFRE